MSESREQPVIIKKYNKKGGGAHGGSWKVAYADFVTAMMAFFLLMWLLNMTSAQKKIQLSNYFQNYSIFEKGGGAAVATKQDAPGEGMFDIGRGIKSAPPKTIMAGDLADKIKKQVEENFKEYRDRVFIFDDNGNLRIEIVDTIGTSFFDAGGTDLSPSGKSLLKGLVPALKDMDRKIIIEGHTDSMAYKDKGYTNWELSTQRASAARMVLEKNGVPQNQIEMVAGYADTKPFIKSNPADPKNRRISIVVDYKTPINQPIPPDKAMKKPKLPDTPPNLVQ
ncbi:MAG TPA: OmpA family protein [Deltaproteobacteria bacterium]|nr:OmpA family protein [Deltaproteobacteria bacterium]HPR54454.1 OmpA family protein [Deltaproteobacteria bacterium]HXK46217.1 OmpA family protein [Deltaproteobacteria bacterium]